MGDSSRTSVFLYENRKNRLGGVVMIVACRAREEEDTSLSPKCFVVDCVCNTEKQAYAITSFYSRVGLD
jgi:hypothetical protein